MKKLILSILCLIWSLGSFSQIDTTSTTLPNKILREVAKDLLRYDGCVEELKLSYQKIDKMTEMDVLKQRIIETLTQKDLNNQFIINQQGLQINQYEKLADDLTKEIKQQRNKTLIWKITTLASIVGGGILLIK